MPDIVSYDVSISYLLLTELIARENESMLNDYYSGLLFPQVLYYPDYHLSPG